MQDHGSHQRIEKMIAFTLLPMEVLISAVIALHAWDASEISANGHSEPPNPYTRHLIVLLSLYIALKYSLVSKMIEVWDKLFTFLFKK